MSGTMATDRKEVPGNTHTEQRDTANDNECDVKTRDRNPRAIYSRLTATTRLPNDSTTRRLARRKQRLATACQSTCALCSSLRAAAVLWQKKHERGRASGHHLRATFVLTPHYIARDFFVPTQFHFSILLFVDISTPKFIDYRHFHYAKNHVILLYR